MTQKIEGTHGKAQEDRSILINFVLDKSGSMATIRDATIAGFNEFLADQQAEGGSAVMTLTLFDTNLWAVSDAVPVGEMLPLDHATYEPGGSTALYDAIGYTMSVTDTFVAANHPDQVLFVIMTDGEENASREFSHAQIIELIGLRQESAGYEFLYLGANQDSYRVSTDMGIRAGRNLDYSADDEDARRAMRSASHNVRAYRRLGSEHVPEEGFFSEEFEAVGATSYEEHRRAQEQGHDPHGDA